MRTIMTIVAVWLLTTSIALAEGVRLGMTRSQVETTLGRPTAAMQINDRTILMYPNQGRVELIGDKVVEAAWVPIDSSSEPVPPPIELPPAVQPTPEITLPPPAVTVTDEPGKASAPTVAPEAVAAGDVTTPPPAATPPAAAAPPSDAALSQNAPEPDALAAQAESAPEASPSPFWRELVLGALIRLGVTIVVLKLAFKWADVHADWSQMIVPALADTVVRSVIAGSAFALWQTEQLFYLDEGIAYFALLFALMKTTHAATLQRAVTVSVAAKLASVVVWSLLSVFMTRLLFA